MPKSVNNKNNNNMDVDKAVKEGRDLLSGEDNEDLHGAGEAEEEDDDLDSSTRIADEQMDYLESLEPCPCYAKCCIDSVVTLFCVTLLG